VRLRSPNFTFSELIAPKIIVRIDFYHQQQKCRPWTLVFLTTRGFATIAGISWRCRQACSGHNWDDGRCDARFLCGSWASCFINATAGNCHHGQLQVTKWYISFGSRAFRISAPKIWNSLPPHILQSQTLDSFRRHLKTYYFQSTYPAP